MHVCVCLSAGTYVCLIFTSLSLCICRAAGNEALVASHAGKTPQTSHEPGQNCSYRVPVASWARAIADGRRWRLATRACGRGGESRHRDETSACTQHGHHCSTAASSPRSQRAAGAVKNDSASLPPELTERYSIMGGKGPGGCRS